MRFLLSPIGLRAAALGLSAIAAFVLAVFAIRKIRRSLVEEAETVSQVPLASGGLPVHTYHAVIQELKQQKYALAAQQIADKKRAKVSDTLSGTVLANLPCGVVFFNRAGLARQANPAARQLLGFASPIGLSVMEIFRDATLVAGEMGPVGSNLEAVLQPAQAGKSAVQGLRVAYQEPSGTARVLELGFSPVIADDASLLGTTCILSDRTEIDAIRKERELHAEISSEMALGLRNSLTTISGYAQQLARSQDPELARQLADDVATEAAKLDRTIGGFLAGARAAASGS